MATCRYCEHAGGDAFICWPLTSLTVVHPGRGEPPVRIENTVSCPAGGIDSGCAVAEVTSDAAVHSIMPNRYWARFEERLGQAAAQLNGRVYESTPDTKT